ncbi:ABC transporter ATP-binding protein [Glycomyces sp. TRM65418]|uniref:ATP-binding cassette domain-containing protein n=1 Tax=Glycomyces sp. TRM65418 TaxID=2867006 RepID=UPI001CE64CE4|nr:ABC transporter ATP-binding protein [Glycomyces sp. TRM65418]MCC3764410.1 ABC transporter ATP-binding protein [Glycomyces sp. TRM65418]QZD54086.1 ABC transporter ATP-binding protein [Glycomyces sp. TRM65418]
MSFAVTLRDVTLKYRDTDALADVNLDLEAGKIYGLLGRNGAGKTSLLSLIAAFRKPTAGEVFVDGEPVWENAPIVSRIALIREGGDFDDTETVKSTIETGQIRPAFDTEYALHLADRFELPLKKRIRELSRGKRSILAAICGLAARAELTMFDEVHLGMDAPTRDAFYKELLAEYMDRPHTVVLSTHLIDEVANYLESVVIVDRGRILRHEEVEVFQNMGATLTGPAAAVDELAASHDVLAEQQLGGTKSITVAAAVDPGTRERAAAAGIEIGPVGLQDLFIHLTEPNRKGA